MDSLTKSRLLAIAISTILPATGALARGPRLVHHDAQADHEEDAHYSDKGAHPSKAQRLGVTLQSRALVDKAGTTEFEVTTGKLDSTTTPPGNIDKLEVELVKPVRGSRQAREKEEFEKEYNHLKGGGYFHALYTRLARGQTLSVKAHVSGFANSNAIRHDDESEHGRVKVELLDVVRSRPDITVQKLDYSTTALANTWVIFSAQLSERMRDVGAHTDCVLLVDGTQVDAYAGMWVDAGTVVTCHLTYNFKAPGQHTVKVVAQNIHPGDYDLSNNSAEGKILIQNPTTLSYTTSVVDSTDTTTQATDEYFSAASTVPDHHTDSTSVQATQSRSFSGHLPVAVGLPLKTISYADSSDGVALSTLTLTDVQADSTFPSGDPKFTTESIISRCDDPTKACLLVHRYQNAGMGTGCTTIDVGWDGGMATYSSLEYCRSAAGYPCSPGDFTINTPPTPSPWGVALVKLGATYSADVVLDDGTAYTAHPSLTLMPSPFNQTYAGAPSCYPGTSVDPVNGQTCMQFSDVSVTREGYAAAGQ